MIRKAGKLVQDKTHGLRTAVHYGHAHRETAKPLRNQKTQPEFQSNRRYHSKMAEHGTHHNHEAKDEIVKYGQAKALKVHKARWKIEVGRQKRDWLAAERIARSI